MTKPVELMNLYWTSAGLPLGSGEISRIEFADRVKASAAAGFTGIGLWHTDLEHILVHRSLREMKAILDDNGMRHLELEFLTDWFVTGARKSESDGRKRRLLEASAALGASHVKIGDCYRTPCPMAKLVEAFAALCKEAEDYGARIGFEFMGSAMLPNLRDSLTMVETAGAKNGGVIVDIAHLIGRGISYGELAATPAHYLTCVELNDCLLPSNPRYDSARRSFCGEGEYDIRGFIAAVDKTGYSGPWAVEVFSPDPSALSMDEYYRQAYRTTIAQFET